MKCIIIIVLITGLTGCQVFSSLTADTLSELSSEDLCRALGTYNDDGGLVLKIYDELNKRPKKINTERCYALERLNEKPEIMELKIEENFHQQPYTRKSKIEYKGKEIIFLEPPSIKPTYKTKIKYKSESNRKKEKVYIKQEEEMSTMMRDSLKKHLSHHRAGVDANK